MPTSEELRSLLQIPSERPNVEYKSWLDVTQNRGKAILAKAAIALANHGGGIIVLGMREDKDEGAALSPQPRGLQFLRLGSNVEYTSSHPLSRFTRRWVTTFFTTISRSVSMVT